jgi:hypothetical protein
MPTYAQNSVIENMNPPWWKVEWTARRNIRNWGFANKSGWLAAHATVWDPCVGSSLRRLLRRIERRSNVEAARASENYDPHSAGGATILQRVTEYIYVYRCLIKGAKIRKNKRVF